MTELTEIVSRLEEEGGRLELRGEKIRFSVPSGNSEAHDLLKELRKYRAALWELLHLRETGQPLWPTESREAERIQLQKFSSVQESAREVTLAQLANDSRACRQLFWKETTPQKCNSPP